MNYKGEKNSNWKGGKPKCKGCGKQLTVHHSKRCRACYFKQADKKQFGHPKSENPNWLGGITPVYNKIRASDEYKRWRSFIFKRSNFSCVSCGKSRVYLEAHHKRRFAIIFKDFLKEYSQFSPFEDKDALVRLALAYKPFWDFENGESLCRSCHDKTKVENFGSGNRKVLSEE